MKVLNTSEKSLCTLIFFSATSSIDHETDAIIQTSLRSKFDKDVTLLTVAHRLQTIMDSDRIVCNVMIVDVMLD